MIKRVVGVNDKGQRVGEHHPQAKLTDREVDLMLELHEAGWGYGRLAKLFDISKSQVRNICLGRKRQMAVEFRVVYLPA